jgi:hypothetical protein
MVKRKHPPHMPTPNAGTAAEAKPAPIAAAELRTPPPRIDAAYSQRGAAPDKVHKAHAATYITIEKNTQ